MPSHTLYVSLAALLAQSDNLGEADSGYVWSWPAWEMITDKYPNVFKRIVRDEFELQGTSPDIFETQDQYHLAFDFYQVFPGKSASDIAKIMGATTKSAGRDALKKWLMAATKKWCLSSEMEKALRTVNLHPYDMMTSNNSTTVSSLVHSMLTSD